MKRDFLALFDISAEETGRLLNRAVEMKSAVAASRPLEGKSIGLLFDKPSTRTRVSFEAGIYQLGGHAICLNPSELQLGRGETIADTARTLSRYLDAMVIRTSGHERLETFAANSTMPLINALSDTHHPCQALADLMTMLEHKGRLEGLRVAFIGDGNNVCNSLIQAAALMGLNLVIAAPEGLTPDPLILEEARSSAGSEILVVDDPHEAAASADVIYTDVWVSMGQEEQTESKKLKLRDYQINSKLVSGAAKDAIVMHCLPAHRGEEITDEVMDGPRSVVFDQAENRLHTQKALLEMLLAPR